MKRYDIGINNFPKLELRIRENSKGQWVDADIAQELYDELVRVREVIASLPIDALGTGTSVHCHPWPIRDEVVDGISKVIHKADKE